MKRITLLLGLFLCVGLFAQKTPTWVNDYKGIVQVSGGFEIVGKSIPLAEGGQERQLSAVYDALKQYLMATGGLQSDDGATVAGKDDFLSRLADILSGSASVNYSILKTYVGPDNVEYLLLKVYQGKLKFEYLLRTQSMSSVDDTGTYESSQSIEHFYLEGSLPMIVEIQSDNLNGVRTSLENYQIGNLQVQFEK